MSLFKHLQLSRKAAQLADLIVSGQRASLRFNSEEQFLQMLGLRPEVVPLPAVKSRRSR